MSASISARPGQLVASNGAVIHTYGGVPPHEWIFELVQSKKVWRIRSANNLGPS